MATREFASVEPPEVRLKGRRKEGNGSNRVLLLPDDDTALHPAWPDWKGGILSTALGQERLIRGLAMLYTFKDYVPVANFLRENPFLLGLLLEARTKIREYFNPGAHVALEVFTDPEAENDRELFALIQAKLPLEDDMDRLDRFYDGWWLDALPAARCKLTIDLE